MIRTIASGQLDMSKTRISVTTSSRPTGAKQKRQASGQTNSISRGKLLDARFGRDKHSLPLYKLLDDDQKRAVDQALHVKTLAVLFEAGVGKTFVAGGVVEQLANEDADQSYLLIVPLQNKETTWIAFIREYLPQIELCFTLEEYDRAFANRLLLLHYEEVAPIIQRLRKRKWTLIAYDESQRQKDRNSLTSRTAAKLRYSGEYKLILTGTPMDERPSDLWAQFRFLRPSVFAEKWSDFETEYMEPVEGEEELKRLRPRSFKWRLLLRTLAIKKRKRKFNYKMLPKFLRLIAPYTIRVKQDPKRIPPVTFRPVPVMLLGSQREQYDTLERDLVITLGKGRKKRTVTADMKAVRIWRCHQIVGGFLKDEEGSVHELGRAKLRKLKHLVKRIDRPVVIFCRYTAEVDAIARELAPLGRVEKFSGKNRKDRPRIQTEFQAGLIDFLVCQIKAGGVGIDLFRSHIGFLYSFSHSWIDFDQAVKRLQRRGQLHPVLMFILYGMETIDELIYEAVMEKRNVVEYVLDNLERRRTLWLRRSISTTSRASSVSSQARRVSRYATQVSRRLKGATPGRTKPRSKKWSTS